MAIPGTESIDCNVLEAARARLASLAARRQRLVVAFSGGKDSLAVLALCREMFGTVDAVFKDQEVIPDSVVSFVEGIRLQPWCRLKWFCVEEEATRWILGQSLTFRQWDAKREHIRPMPDYAIRCAAASHRGSAWYRYVLAQYPGERIILLTGLRADESNTRRSSVLNCWRTPELAATDASVRVKIGRPIYDWSEADVFKFLHDSNTEYCRTYDAQAMAGRRLRVHHALSAEAMKDSRTLAEIEPEFFGRLTAIFPEVVDHVRYYHQIVADLSFEQLPQNLDGLLTYCRAKLAGHPRLSKAETITNTLWNLHQRSPEQYPIRHIFLQIRAGGIFRKMQAVSRKRQTRSTASNGCTGQALQPTTTTPT